MPLAAGCPTSTTSHVGASNFEIRSLFCLLFFSKWALASMHPEDQNSHIPAWPWQLVRVAKLGEVNQNKLWGRRVNFCFLRFKENHVNSFADAVSVLKWGKNFFSQNVKSALAFFSPIVPVLASSLLWLTQLLTFFRHCCQGRSSM